MIRSLKKLFGTTPDKAASKKTGWRAADGVRVYAVGDVHGRLDLLRQMISLIDADHSSRNAASGEKQLQLILLGDLVDRGPDSAGVIDYAMELARSHGAITLAGNHEEMLLLSFRKLDMLRSFIKWGGRETILSYPISRRRYEELTLEELQAELPKLVPLEHRNFLESLPNSLISGDYAFVHAGIMPGVPLAEQKPANLRWIREPFLSDRSDHGAMIIHGHTITDEVDERANRIGIDTGAYASGRLTAIGLEDHQRWYLEASLPTV